MINNIIDKFFKDNSELSFYLFGYYFNLNEEVLLEYPFKNTERKYMVYLIPNLYFGIFLMIKLLVYQKKAIFFRFVKKLNYCLMN